MLSLGCILISDLVVANLFMHSLPGMILLYLAALFYSKGVFAWDIITFVRFMYCYRSRIIDSHTATPAEVDQKIHQPVHFLSLTLKQKMQLTYNTHHVVRLLQESKLCGHDLCSTTEHQNIGDLYWCSLARVTRCYK